VEYQYNAANQLVSREEGYDSSGSQSNSHTEHFTYHGNSIDLAFNEDSLPVRRYVWSPVSGELLTDERASWITGEFYGTYWSANDHLGTVGQLLDEEAVIAEHREYDSFGAIDAVYSSMGGSRPVANMFSSVAHAGRMWDDDSDLYYNRARWYDPSTGKFINEDPARDGSNWYAYAGNDPVNYYDPTGLSARKPTDNLISKVAYGAGDAVGKLSQLPSQIVSAGY
jgi:RHS repeat-associated protein